MTMPSFIIVEYVSAALKRPIRNRVKVSYSNWQNSNDKTLTVQNLEMISTRKNIQTEREMEGDRQICHVFQDFICF